MRFPIATACLLLLISFCTTLLAVEVDPENDWPVWRGPRGTGVAEPNQKIPLKWSATENVIWKATIPGRGHSSPTIVGKQVFITTADEEQEIQSVLCFDRGTGKQLWKTDVHKGNLDKKGNKKTSQASSTVACDGEKLYVNFLNDGAVITTALDLDGKQLWQRKVSEFVTHQGFGSSPALHGELVYVTADHKGGGVVAALHRDDGRVVWSDSRPKLPNYTSAVVLNTAGKEQVLVSGCKLVSAYEPATGKKLWEVPGATEECVTTIVTDGERVFVSGGYPRNHTQAIRADGSGKTDWESNARVYVPSMIVHEGYLYAIQDPGIAMCWKCDTGKQIWEERVGGTFSASLVLVGDNLMSTTETGETLVFKANPKKFELVAKNKLGDEAYATPSVCGGRIYLRTIDKSSDKPQEMLYCIGTK